MITREVTGTWLNPDETPSSGDVEFRPSSYLANSAEDKIITTSGIAFDLDAAGHISVPLLVTDGLFLAPDGWLWEIIERIDGRENRNWFFALESGAGAVDLADLMPVDDPPTFINPYVDQDVTIGSAPVLSAANFTDLPSGSVVGVRTQTIIKSTNYTLVLADHICIVMVSGVTITLPSAAGDLGKQFVVKNVSSGTVTIDSVSTLDSESAVTLSQWDSYTLVSDNANWVVV